MNSVLELVPLSMPWIGRDPFIFTVHHVDHYPAGNEAQGPQPGVAGRQIGADFSYRDGWSMYHGRQVPGFPQHPHRGFETVTVVRRGFIDHSDSLGATARFGQGDTQWLTAGAGIQHSEMFPLIDSEGANELELFQIWLNLPPREKMVPPYFRMLWSEEIPTVLSADGQTSIDIIAGRFEDHRAPAPPSLTPAPTAGTAPCGAALPSGVLARTPCFRLPAPVRSCISLPRLREVLRRTYV